MVFLSKWAQIFSDYSKKKIFIFYMSFVHFICEFRCLNIFTNLTFLFTWTFYVVRGNCGNRRLMLGSSDVDNKLDGYFIFNFLSTKSFNDDVWVILFFISAAIIDFLSIYFILLSFVSCTSTDTRHSWILIPDIFTLAAT